MSKKSLYGIFLTYIPSFQGNNFLQDCLVEICTDTYSKNIKFSRKFAHSFLDLDPDEELLKRQQSLSQRRIPDEELLKRRQFSPQRIIFNLLATSNNSTAGKIQHDSKQEKENFLEYTDHI